MPDEEKTTPRVEPTNAAAEDEDKTTSRFESEAHVGAVSVDEAGSDHAGDEDLLTENRRLLSELKALTENARENEEKLKRFQDLELDLVSAETLAALFNLLIFGYKDLFGLDTVTLVLADPEYEIQRALETDGIELKLRRHLGFATTRQEMADLGDIGITPHLGPYGGREHGWLFQDIQPDPISVAVLPLVRRNASIGVLSLGSADGERFRDGDGTDFLERLTRLATICVVSHINRQRAREKNLIDAVTGLKNRAYFDQRLVEEITRAQRLKQPITALFVDLDQSRPINERYGTKAGDSLLKSVAKTITHEARFNDLLARFAGDQFVILASGAHSRDGVTVARRIRAAVEALKLDFGDGREVDVTTSVGVATILPEGNAEKANDEGDFLIIQAKKSVLMAKERGRNRVVCVGTVKLGEETPPAEESV